MQKSPEDGVTAPLHLTRTNSEPLHTHALHGTWTLTVAERVGELLNCSTAFTPSISFTPSTPYSPSPPLVSGQGYLWLSHRDPGAASWPLALHSFQRWRGLVGAEQQEAGETWTQAERRATREQGRGADSSSSSEELRQRLRWQQTGEWNEAFLYPAIVCTSPYSIQCAASRMVTVQSSQLGSVPFSAVECSAVRGSASVMGRGVLWPRR